MTEILPSVRRGHHLIICFTNSLIMSTDSKTDSGTSLQMLLIHSSVQKRTKTRAKYVNGDYYYGHIGPAGFRLVDNISALL